MKSTTRNKIVGAVRKQLEEVLGPAPRTLPDTYKQMYANVSKGLEGKVDDKTLQGAFQTGAMLAIWTEAGRTLKDKPEPTPEQLEKTLAEIKMLDFAFILRTSMRQLARKLQPSPPGKRPTLNELQRNEVIVKVRKLTNQGTLSRKKAYEQIAVEYGVHWRTVQNVCAKASKEGGAK